MLIEGVAIVLVFIISLLNIILAILGIHWNKEKEKK